MEIKKDQFLVGSSRNCMNSKLDSSNIVSNNNSYHQPSPLSNFA